jgi:quercetin dioxygenase-like cupin family protein
MKHVHYSEVPADPVPEQGAEGVKIQWLIGPDDGAANFAMRRFELAAGGHTPRHSHPWEHEVFILCGEGTVLGADGPRRFRAGDVIFLPEGEQHQFRNDGAQPVTFLCLVPARP